MNRHNKLKLRALSAFAREHGDWLKPSFVAERLDFSPRRSAWTYFKRLWRFGLLERRARGKGTLEYRISESGATRLRWLRSRSGAVRSFAASYLKEEIQTPFGSPSLEVTVERLLEAAIEPTPAEVQMPEIKDFQPRGPVKEAGAGKPSL